MDSRISLEFYQDNPTNVVNFYEPLTVVVTFADGYAGDLQISDVNLPAGFQIISGTERTYPYADNPNYIVALGFNVRAIEGYDTTNNVISINGANYKFLDGSPGVDLTTESFRIDTVLPTLDITTPLGPGAGVTDTTGVTFTFKFSEGVTGFDQSDIGVSSSLGAFSNFTKISDSLYTAVFTAAANVSAFGTEIRVKYNAYKDFAGNTAQQDTTEVINIDTLVHTDILPPSPFIAVSPFIMGPEGGTISVRFDEAVTGFGVEDIQLPTVLRSGSISQVSPPSDTTNFEFFIKPPSDIAPQDTFQTIRVLAGGYADLAGNLGLGGSDSFRLDTLPPGVSVSLSDAQIGSGETLRVTFAFTEAVTEFDLNDVVLNKAVGSFGELTGGGSTYQVNFTPLAGITESGVQIAVNGSYADLRGNVSTAQSSATFAIDTVPPSVSITLSDTEMTSGETMRVTFAFTEPVTDFDLSDVVLNKAVGSFGALTMVGNSYQFDFTPLAGITESGVQIILNGSYTDLFGNAGSAQSSATFAVDTLPPTVSVTLSDAEIASGETMRVTFAFSEAVTGFDLSDVVLSKAVGSFGTLTAVGNTYQVDFTPLTGITESGVQITVNGSYTDLVGNAGSAQSSSAFAVDTVAPTLSITAGDTNLTRGESLTLTFTFSEVVQGFTADDVRLDGAAVSLTGFTAVEPGKIFTAVYTPPQETIDASNIFSVAAGSYTDSFGNSGAMSVSPNVSIDTIGKILFGTTDSDVIFGTAGADRISGVPQSGAGAGVGSVDLLVGSGGADIFVLGNSSTAFYNDGNNNSAGVKDFATIADFSKAQGDKIEVKAGTYFFSELTVGKLTGAGLYLDTNNNHLMDNKDELVGFLVGVAPGSVSTTQDLIMV